MLVSNNNIEYIIKDGTDMYALGKTARHCVERSVGLTVDELMALDFDDEIDLVKRVRGSRPTFGNVTNVVLGTGRVFTDEDIECGLREMDAYYGV